MVNLVPGVQRKRHQLFDNPYSDFSVYRSFSREEDLTVTSNVSVHFYSAEINATLKLFLAMFN